MSINAILHVEPWDKTSNCFEKPNSQPNLKKWIKPCPIHLARVLLNTEMELEQIKSFHITEYRRFTAECSGYHVVHYLIFYGRVTQNR